MCMGIVRTLAECGIMVALGLSHEGYNPYSLENHSTADLYYDATNHTFGSIFHHT